MSSVYIQEPATKGKLVIHTDRGPIDVELWSKEAPKTTRHFLQLVLQGRYTNTIFNRLVPKFILQGGEDPNREEQTEEKPLQKELHPRLRFVRRGLVALATHSQFFITLSNTEHLQGQYTIFGKVVGDSLFNVLEMADQPVDADERPRRPPRILSIEILENPYTDLKASTQPPSSLSIPSLSTATSVISSTATASKKKRSQGTLLSFQHDDDESGILPTQKKLKSAYDLLPHLAQGNASSTSSTSTIPSIPRIPSTTSTTFKEPSSSNTIKDTSSLVSSSVKEKAPASHSPPPLHSPSLLNSSPHHNPSPLPNETRPLPPRSSPPSSVTSWRASLATYHHRPLPASIDVLSKLNQFQQRLHTSSSRQPEPSTQEDDSPTSWLAHTLQCEPSKLGRDRLTKEVDDDPYVVIDTRQRMQTLHQMDQSRRKEKEEKKQRAEWGEHRKKKYR